MYTNTLNSSCTKITKNTKPLTKTKLAPNSNPAIFYNPFYSLSPPKLYPTKTNKEKRKSGKFSSSYNSTFYWFFTPSNYKNLNLEIKLSNRSLNWHCDSTFWSMETWVWFCDLFTLIEVSWRSWCEKKERIRRKNRNKVSFWIVLKVKNIIWTSMGIKLTSTSDCSSGEF